MIDAPSLRVKAATHRALIGSYWAETFASLGAIVLHFNHAQYQTVRRSRDRWNACVYLHRNDKTINIIALHVAINMLFILSLNIWKGSIQRPCYRVNPIKKFSDAHWNAGPVSSSTTQSPPDSIQTNNCFLFYLNRLMIYLRNYTCQDPSSLLAYHQRPATVTLRQILSYVLAAWITSRN